MYPKEWAILKELEKGDYVTSSHLAKKLNLSPKTIRKYISNLQEELGDKLLRIESKTGKGYRLLIYDQETYHQVMSEERGPQFDSVQERQLYLLNQLLTHPYLKLEEVESTLYLSRRTLSGIVRGLKEILKRYQLVISHKPHYGLYLEGQEEAIRLMMVLVEGVTLHPLSASEEQTIQDFLLSQGIDADFYRSNIILVLRAAITRSKLGFHLSKSQGTLYTDLETFSAQYGWDLQLADMISIEEAILAFQPNHSSGIRGYDLVTCLSFVEEAFGIDFTKDAHFIDSLSQHVQKLYERVRGRISLKNPLLGEIKQNLKNEFIMASLLAGALAREWGLPIVEDEIGFLSLIFATSTSQIKDLKKHMLVICFETGSSKSFLETTYKRLFGRYVHQVTVCNPRDIKDTDLSQYDLIVSTVELAELDNHQPHYVSYFLEERDKEAIKRWLTTSENLFVDQILEETILLSSIKAETKTQVVSDICKVIEDRQSIDLRDSVLERLSMGVTQIGHKVALLHPKKQVDKHFISIGVLSSPLYWENSEISVVCLVSLPTIDRVSKLLYQILSTFMIEDFYVEWLLQSPTPHTLQSIFKTIKEKEFKGYVY